MVNRAVNIPALTGRDSERKLRTMHDACFACSAPFLVFLPISAGNYFNCCHWWFVLFAVSGALKCLLSFLSVSFVASAAHSHM